MRPTSSDCARFIRPTLTSTAHEMLTDLPMTVIRDEDMDPAVVTALDRSTARVADDETDIDDDIEADESFVLGVDV